MITHTITENDTLSPLAVTLTQVNELGVPTAVSLSGKTVKFKMVGRDGTVKLAETDTGITVTSAVDGKVQYDFSSAAVDTPGMYYGWFVVYDGSETDTFPANGRTLAIHIVPDE